MPLIIYDIPLDLEFLTPLPRIWEEYPKLKVDSENLRDMPVKLMNQKHTLYVGQREFAGTSPANDSISFLGTDSATTCHIAVLTDKVSGATCLGHFDGNATTKGVNGLVDAVLHMSNPDNRRLELTLAGGFADLRKISVKISTELLGEFNKISLNINLMAAVITDFNTVEKSDGAFPIIYGLGVDMKRREIFPAIFTDRGPNYPLRNAQRDFCGSDCFPCLYDLSLRRVVINPFDYSKHYDPIHLQKMIGLSAEEILKTYSTSPLQEPPNFPKDFQNTYIFLKENPYPMKTIFPNESPVYYKMSSNGQWVFDGNSPPS